MMCICCVARARRADQTVTRWNEAIEPLRVRLNESRIVSSHGVFVNAMAMVVTRCRQRGTSVYATVLYSRPMICVADRRRDAMMRAELSRGRRVTSLVCRRGIQTVVSHRPSSDPPRSCVCCCIRTSPAQLATRRRAASSRLWWMC